MDLEEDRKVLQKFTHAHTAGKQLTHNYEVAKQAYLEQKRGYDHRRHEALVNATKKQEEDDNETTSEAIHEENKNDCESEPQEFTEVAPEPPALPTFPTSYWDQISKDVDRSLWKQVPDEAERNLKRDQLHRMICAVIYTTRDDEQKPLHYFQGYHDIAAVCLLTCGETLGFSLLKRLSTSYLRYVIVV